MKKHFTYLFHFLGIGIVVLSVNNIAKASVTYGWNAGTSSGTPSSTSGSDPNITPGNVSRINGSASGLEDNTSPSTGYTGASGNYNFEAHAVAGTTVNLSTSTYFSITLTPSTGYAIMLDSLSFGSRSTGTGPTSIAIYSSIDSYNSPIATITGLNNDSNWYLQNPSLSGSLTGAAGQAVTLDIYGYNGSSGGTTINWRIDDINFTVTAVPEPGTWGAISGAGLLGLCGVRAWRQRRQQNAAV
jgi:hypothetical protein